MREFAVEADAPTTLQPERAEEAANVTFFGPGPFVHRVTLDAHAPGTHEAELTKVASYDPTAADPSAGAWIVGAYGLGTNVMLRVRVVERFP